MTEGWYLDSPAHLLTCPSVCAAVKIKKPIQTKFRMPVLNWVALKPSQINGTVFNDIDDESILQVKHTVQMCYFYLLPNTDD